MTIEMLTAHNASLNAEVLRMKSELEMAQRVIGYKEEDLKRAVRIGCENITIREKAERDRDQWMAEVQTWRKDLKREKDAHAITEARRLAVEDAFNPSSRAFQEAKEKCSYDRQSLKPCPCENHFVQAIVWKEAKR